MLDVGADSAVLDGECGGDLLVAPPRAKETADVTLTRGQVQAPTTAYVTTSILSPITPSPYP